MSGPDPAHHLALFGASPTPMLLVDHEAGVIVEANPAAARFYGYAPGAMHGLPVTSLSPDAPERLRQVAHTESGALSFEVDHRLATGDIRRVAIGSTMVEVEARRLVYSVIRPADEVASERALADLRASEERYRDVVERLGAGVVLFDPEGRPAWANETMASMLGYTPAELIARGGFVRDDRSPTWGELLHRAPTERGSLPHDLELRHRDGRTVIGEVRTRRLHDGAVEAVIHDVTSQRAAEAELAATEERYRLLVEAMDDLMLAYGPDGRITFVNPAVMRASGYAAVDLIGHDIVDMFEPRDRERHLLERERILAGQPSLREVRMTRADGTPLWVEARSHALQNGGVEVIARVITDRKALEHERDRLASALDQSSDVVVLTDLHGITLYVNRAFERMYGIARAEAVGFPATRWFTVEPGAEPPARILVRLRATGHWHGDVRQHGRDGTQFTASTRLALVRDPDGEPVAFLGIASDVTRERAVAERMAESAKIEAVGHLAGGVAHDFNNLLTGVLGYAELAADASPGDPALVDDLRQIMDAAHRAQALTRQLLAFGRRSILKPRVLDAGEAVLAIEPALRQLAGGGITLAVESDAGVGAVRVDPTMLEHALVGLVENAREAMPAGGRIRITIGRPVPEDDAPPGDWAVIRVMDGGAGMDPEVFARALEPFFSTKQVSGAGLGLPMVNGFVIQSGGHLRVRSTPGHGTIVSLMLPLEAGFDAPVGPRREPGSEPGVATAPGTGPTSGPVVAGASTEVGPITPSAGAMPDTPATVLVVDDEAVLRTIAERVMVLAGYRVLTAASGEEALAVAATTGRIDLLFTDIVMPGMHGLTLTALLRAERPDLRVLVTSGFAPDDVDRRGVGLAETPFLPKPYTPAQLTEVVAQLLAGRGER